MSLHCAVVGKKWPKITKAYPVDKIPKDVQIYVGNLCNHVLLDFVADLARKLEPLTLEGTGNQFNFLL